MTVNAAPIHKNGEYRDKVKVYAVSPAISLAFRLSRWLLTATTANRVQVAEIVDEVGVPEAVAGQPGQRDKVKVDPQILTSIASYVIYVPRLL
jgi:hypothetical protein